MDQRAIKCEIDEVLMEKALRSWRKRVEVVGVVRYRNDGLAVSVKASDIIPFPNYGDIPSLKQLRDLLASN